MKKLKFIFAAAGLLLAIGFSVVPIHKSLATNSKDFTYYVVAIDGSNYKVQITNPGCTGTGSPCEVSSTVMKDGNNEIPQADATELSEQNTLP